MEHVETKQIKDLTAGYFDKKRIRKEKKERKKNIEREFPRQNGEARIYKKLAEIQRRLILYCILLSCHVHVSEWFYTL